MLGLSPIVADFTLPNAELISDQHRFHAYSVCVFFATQIYTDSMTFHTSLHSYKLRKPNKFQIPTQDKEAISFLHSSINTN